MRREINYYLLRINRLLVWLLLAFLVIFVISGYGITNPKLINALTGGILNFSSSLTIHRTLDLPLLSLLMIHILIELKFTLTRWGLRHQKALNAFLVILGIFFTSLLILMDTLRL
ncbi:MAG: hypothetical protein PVF15_06255 [Candidatus Bathyarchaeota archaeon]